jgi:hypothetical protein
LLVAHQIALRLHVVGFGLCQLRVGRRILLAGSSDSSVCVLDIRLRTGCLAAGVDRSDGYVYPRGFCQGDSVGVVRFRSIHRHLIVLRINLNQRSSGRHVLVVFDQQLQDMTGDSGADRIHVAVNLRIVRILITGEVAPQKEASYQEHHDSYNKKHAEPGIACLKALPAKVSVRRWQWSWLSCRPLGLRLIVSHHRVCIFCHDYYPELFAPDLLTLEILPHTLFSKANRLRQGYFRYIVGVEAGNITFVGRCQSLLRLNYL